MDEGKEILTTERLVLREMTDGDFAALCGILQDRRVMYAYEHAFSDEEVAEWLGRQKKHYAENGFGLWLVCLKETGEPVGQCGLTLQDFRGVKVLEVGYLLSYANWHKGYASEAAAACRKYAFDILGAEEVYSIIRDGNSASVSVALRNGMSEAGKVIKHYYGIDMPHTVYRVRREEVSGAANLRR